MERDVLCFRNVCCRPGPIASMLHEFFRLSSEGIWCFQIEGTVTADLSADEQIAVFFEKAYLSECNDRMAQMYGFERAADLCGTPLRQLMVPEDPRNVE